MEKDPDCDELVVIGGNHYKWVDTKGTFEEVRSICQELKGDLVMFKNEMDFKLFAYSYGNAFLTCYIYILPIEFFS